MGVTDEIKNRLDIIDIVSESVKLRRSGKNYTGFCPFHPNTRTPAFVVFPDSGTWRCFGQCNEGGDIFRFVMKREGWDFPQSLKYLADRAGVVLRELTPEQVKANEQESVLTDLLTEAASFYNQQLASSPEGKPALDYLHKRSIRDTTIQSFQLGYAPDSWDSLIRYLQGKGYTIEQMDAAGMLSQRDGGGSYDRFRNRIMIPIRDPGGKMTGFGARILDPNDVPKFLNSPQTVLFDKGRILFGLDSARRSIQTLDQVVIVEGYLDVIALHQAGFMNVVSPMGTALTEEQMFLIKKYTRRIVLALDADAAGEKATLRGLEIARSASDQDTDFIFPVNGYMQQVKRINADIRVATLPPGKDPDEVVEQDIEEWKGLIIKAKPLVIHVMDTLADGKDIKDPRTKGEIAALVSPLIEDVLSPVERDAYRQRLARLLRVDEASISGQTNLTPGIGRRSVKRSTSPGQPVHSQGLAEVKSGTAEYILTLLASDPDLLYKLDRMLQQAGLARIDGDDFVQTPLREVFELIRQAVDQDEIEPVDFVRNNISNLLGSDALKLDNLSNIGTSGRDYLTDLYRQFLRLRELVYKGELQKLRFLLEEESSSEYREADADITGQVVRFNALLNQIFSATSRLSLPKS